MSLLLAASPDPGWMSSQLVFVAIAGATWLFRMIKRSSDSRRQQEAKPAEPAASATLAELAREEEERTRRVREEIRRKIAERRAGAAAAPRVFEEKWEPEAQAGAVVGQAPAAASLPPPLRAPAPQPVAALQGGVSGPSAGALWLEELRTRDSARRAILVREILGPPVALR